MPASASSSIAAVADQVGGVDLPDPVALAPGLRYVLRGVLDPRKRRGIRHGLVVVLTVAVRRYAPVRQRMQVLHRRAEITEPEEAVQRPAEDEGQHMWLPVIVERLALLDRDRAMPYFSAEVVGSQRSGTNIDLCSCHLH
jgi:hypothetical protein